MLLRILLVTALIGASLGAVKDGRVLAGLGLVGSCTAVSAVADGSVTHACKAGKLEGRPNLSKKSCVSEGQRGSVEYWRCPAAVKTDAPRE